METRPPPPSGRRVVVSGHSAQADDGTLAGPFGKVPSEVSLEEASLAARRTALSVLGSVKRAIGDLDRIAAWIDVTGTVNAESGYAQTTNAINGFVRAHRRRLCGPPAEQRDRHRRRT